MHCFQTNLEVCVACTTELGVESLDMSAECMEFVKRGHKKYKALEAIVKGWKAKVVEVVSEALPKKHMMTWCAEACLVGGALHATCQSTLVISVSAFTIFRIFGMR
jgi:hypothetical protein